MYMHGWPQALKICILINPWRACATGLQQLFVFVCVCAYAAGLIFQNSNESARKTYGFPQCCNCLIYKVEFFIKQSLRETTEFEWQSCWRTCWPFCLPSQVPERISIHMTLLSTIGCFCYKLCHCVWCNAIQHTSASQIGILKLSIIELQLLAPRVQNFSALFN